MKADRETMKQLESELRRTRPNGAPPADLHGSILQALRRAERELQPDVPRSFWRWVAASGLAVGVTSLVCLGWPHTASQTPPWTEAGVVLERAHAAPRQASAAVFAPLATELEFVDRDVRKAVAVLLASVP